MEISQKILQLRKGMGMSQEDLAEKLQVSRQSISRWEQGSALPDANNILHLCKVFSVSADYLLQDEYDSSEDIPQVNRVREDQSRQIMVFLVTLEAMSLILQFMCVIILQNVVFGVLSFLPIVAAVGGFEFAHRKYTGTHSERTLRFRKTFYKLSAWLGLYFPIRLLVMTAVRLYHRPYSSLVLECVILAVYLAAALIVNLEIERKDLQR